MKIRQAISCFFICFSIASGCVQQYRCYEDDECPEPKICDRGKGDCVYKCITNRDCESEEICVNHECEPKPIEKPEPQQSLSCPEEMVLIDERFCIDRFEASRPDATEISRGSDDARALSVKGVIPWQASTNAVAESACAASEKRLCSPAEWEYACRGPDKTNYAYGDIYDPVTCNGIETFGRDNFHLLRTGSIEECTNDWGVFDMNGNLWERVAGGDDTTVRGGAFNCIDSASLHRCDYVPGNWTPSALGFRCCLDPVVTETLPVGGTL